MERRVTHIVGHCEIGFVHIGNAHPCFYKGILEGIPEVVVNGVVDGIAKYFVQAVVVPNTCVICLVIEIHEVDTLPLVHAIVVSEHRVIITQ
jgi:hypothetical protein